MRSILGSSCRAIGLTGMVCAAAAVMGCGGSRSVTSGLSADERGPLRSARVMAFAATSNPAACRAFYEGKLGLRVIEADSMALVFDANGTTIRIQHIPDHVPVKYTVLGWRVSDIRKTTADLSAAGVSVEHFGWMKMQDSAGVATFPNGDKVVWFKDPDGNVLSIAELR